jgi:hypothetical protein
LVVRHRQKRVDTRACELAGYVRQAHEATEQRALAQQALNDHDMHARSVSEAESSRLQQGQATIADLQRAEQWQQAQLQRTRWLDQKLAAARDAEDAARENKSAAQRTLLVAHADASAIEHHRNAHLDRVRAREQAALEEQALESHCWKGSRSRS